MHSSEDLCMKKENNAMIRFIRPLLPEPAEWSPYLRESYQSRYFANTGPATRLFERRLAERYARGRAVVTGPNATNSLTAALQALGVRGKVLTPAYTFPATAQAILMAGCEPVFSDVAADTWEMDARAAMPALERGGISALLHVRPYGLGRDVKSLEDLAKSHRVPLIIDSAAALGAGASVSGPVGQQGDVEVFSLHATKVFAIGEGGAAFMRPELEERFRRVSNFGLHNPDVTERGQNSKLSDFQAAVGLAVLDRIDGFIARRQQIACRYHAALSGHPAVRVAPRPELAPWQYYPVLLTPGIDLDGVIARAAGLGLELKRGYNRPLHLTTCFSPFAASPLPITEDLCDYLLCLPVYSDMPEELAETALERCLQALRT